MFRIKSDFICKFKIGDNINYNLKILGLLYKTESSIPDNEKELLYKPMIITIASICEAILYDFHIRIKYNTSEGVQNLAKNIIERIRSKKIDEFEKYIASAKKSELFGEQSSIFYKELDDLRKLRNRIHIQNKKNHFEADDNIAFSFERRVIAEKILERILKQMSKKYNRPEPVTGFVDDFVLPWDEHFIEKR